MILKLFCTIIKINTNYDRKEVILVTRSIELMQKYNIDTVSTSAYSLIYSYAKDSVHPIIFSHYSHEHQSPKEINYNKQYDYYTLYVFMSGKFGFMFDDILCNPSYGDVIIIRAREKFTSCFYTTSFIDYYEINFPREFFNKINIINPFSQVFHNQNTPDRNLVVFDEQSKEEVIDLLKKIDTISNSEGDFRDFLTYSYIIRIAELICDSQSNSNINFHIKKPPITLKTALNYIHSNYTSICGVEEVAKHCSITATHLARLFKKFLSCSPNEYISNLRISYAKYLLQNGSNLTEACYNSGFSSYTYFISKFKAVTGTSPSKWKNSKNTIEI